ncbi:MAG: 16S rRNA (uracil(1498)-N(3))-methyltransferase [Treponema sp.]|nr:16S rRNA (uracil(1498)-N(3))-methyltransferase [Treponema sp.]
MKQFVLPTEPDGSGLLRLVGGDYRYLVRVRRLAVGECFPALLPDGRQVSAKVRSVEGASLTVELDGPETAAKLPPFRIVLFQALPKGEKLDRIVRQAGEAGTAEILPFESEFSDIKADAVGEAKFARWQRIVREARQQSGSPVATRVHRPVKTDGLFAYWDTLRKETPDLKGLLFHHLPLADKGLHKYIEGKIDTVVIAIGPEGGFSPAEVERFLSEGFLPCTLGDTVLRTETAALYAQAAVRTILRERDSWKSR